MPPFVPPPSRSPAQTSLRLLPQRVRLGVEFLSPQPSSSPRTSNYGSRDVHDQPRGNKPLSTGCLSRYSAAFHGGLGLPASTNRQTVSRLYGVGSFDSRMRPVPLYVVLFYSWGYGLGLRTCSYSGLRSLVYIYIWWRKKEGETRESDWLFSIFVFVRCCKLVV